MTQPFYNSAIGDPIVTKRRVAPQPTVGVPVIDMSLYHDYRSNLGPLSINPTTYAQRTLNSSIDVLKRMLGKITAPDSTQDMGDWDLSDPMGLLSLANLARKYTVSGTITITSITRSGATATATVASTAALTSGDELWITGATQTDYNGRFTITVATGTTFTYTVANTPATPATGTPVYSIYGYNRWLFGASQTTSASPRLSICEDYDQGIPFRFHDCAVKSMTFGAQPNQNFDLAIALAVGEFTLHGAVTQTAGSGSTKPVLTKFWEGNLAADGVDRDIFIKYISAGLMRGKIGTAASFGATSDVFVAGYHSRVYNELVDEVDRRIGVVAEQIRAYWPTGYTASANDVWQILSKIASWSASLGVQRPCSSVNVTFILNDNEITEQGWSLELATDGVSRIENTYGRQSATSRISGQVSATIKPTREIQDRDLQNALLLGTVLPVVIEAPLDTEIGISGKDFRTRFVLPAVTFEGNAFSPAAGGKDRKEALTGVAGVPDSAYTYDGDTWSDAWTAEIRNDITSSIMATS